LTLLSVKSDAAPSRVNKKKKAGSSAWKPTGSALPAYRAANEERAVRQLGEGRLAVGVNEKVRWQMNSHKSQPDYFFGNTDAEHERLIRQAKRLAPAPASQAD